MAGPGYQELVERLRGMGRVVVAFSGGVDSSLLLAAAVDGLGPGALAVSVRSPLQPDAELAEAERLAVELGARHRSVTLDELAHPLVRANPPERCYHCKRLRFEALLGLARSEGAAEVVEGSQADDPRDHRPGLRAAAELGIRSPLLELGLGKAEIRRLARARGLGNWDRPSAACLASRIPYGQPLEPARLRRVERAERALAGLGLGQLRVRDHGRLARLEVAPERIGALLAEPLRQRVRELLCEAGYTWVSLDLAGYRSGAMNEELGGDG